MLALAKTILSAVSKSLPAVSNSPRKRFFWGFLIPCFIFLNFSLSLAETGLSTIPSEFGKVIYSCQEKSPNQLFVIGIAHRDSLTGLSVPGISRVQAEVYKLGEWLIRNEGCELLLPEGFFAGSSARTGKEQAKGEAQKSGCPQSIDIKALEEKLSDNRAFVNAELLLKRNYPLRLRQVEDPKIHQAVGNSIRKLVECGNDTSEYIRIRSDLDSLQERRTVAMLQRIPEIIQAEFQQGNITAKKAIFTIGLSHLPRIIRYLEENKVRFYSPLLGMDKKEEYTLDLNLKKENFGISILLPLTLATDPKTLKITGLDDIIAWHRRHSSAGSSSPRN